MARHAQPRELAELKGATKKDPQRYRTQPPKSARALGKPPKGFTPEERAAWLDLEEMTPKGVLTYADRAVLTLGASLYSQFMADRAGFPATKITHFVGVLARLGLTPSDRQRLTRELEPNDGDSFGDF